MQGSAAWEHNHHLLDAPPGIISAQPGGAIIVCSKPRALHCKKGIYLVS
jgi:hypothetical protein